MNIGMGGSTMAGDMTLSDAVLEKSMAEIARMRASGETSSSIPLNGGESRIFISTDKDTLMTLHTMESEGTTYYIGLEKK